MSLKLSLSFILIFCLAFLLGSRFGREKQLEDFSLMVENAGIAECDGNGCYVSFSDKRFESFYAYCDDNHFCNWEGKTTEDKAKDVELKKIFDDVLNDAQLKN